MSHETKFDEKFSRCIVRIDLPLNRFTLNASEVTTNLTFVKALFSYCILSPNSKSILMR